MDRKQRYFIVWFILISSFLLYGNQDKASLRDEWWALRSRFVVLQPAVRNLDRLEEIKEELEFVIQVVSCLKEYQRAHRVFDRLSVLQSKNQEPDFSYRKMISSLSIRENKKQREREKAQKAMSRMREGRPPKEVEELKNDLNLMTNLVRKYEKAESNRNKINEETAYKEGQLRQVKRLLPDSPFNQEAMKKMIKGVGDSAGVWIKSFRFLAPVDLDNVVEYPCDIECESDLDHAVKFIDDLGRMVPVCVAVQARAEKTSETEGMYNVSVRFSLFQKK